MNSTNLIVSFGALLFLLLIVGSTGLTKDKTDDGDVLFGEKCVLGGRDSTKRCHVGKSLKCLKDGVLVPEDGKTEGICSCPDTFYWIDRGGVLGFICDIDPKREYDANGSKQHGQSCKGPESCKKPTVCHDNVFDAAVGKNDEEADTEGRLFDLSSKVGTCICTGNKAFIDKDCKMPKTKSSSSVAPTGGTERTFYQLSNFLAIGSLTALPLQLLTIFF